SLDYNKFFLKNTALILKEIAKNQPNLRPEMLKGNKENTEIMKYLEINQFILLTKKRPRRGIMLKHQLINYIAELNKVKIEINNNFQDVSKQVLGIEGEPINPFGDKIFEFLAGSAQLEGSTINAGETKDMILNDIYPDKPKKDIIMIKNLNEAMIYLIKNIESDITIEHIKELNKLIMFGLHKNAGEYKITQNKIQGNPSFKTASPREVAFLMNELCNKLKKINSKEECLKKSGYIHNELQRIHPFSDGNSRTTRMVLNWLFLKYKLPILVLKMGSYDEYMNLTKLSDKRDDKKLTYLFEMLLLHECLIN
ncbi:MAG: Fic family protein, partial [Candidatus Woesearchaeota archaeon]